VSGPEFLRTRLTWLTYAQLAVFGYFLYGFGPSVPLQRDELQVSSAVGGLHGTALATGSTLAGLTFAVLSRRVGRTGTLRVGLLGLAAGTLLYCLVPALPVTLAGALVCGLFGSYVVTGSVVVLSAAHGPAGPAAISEANAAAAAAGLVAPLLLGAGAAIGIGWQPGLLVAALAAVLVWVLSVRDARRPAVPTGAVVDGRARATPAAVDGAADPPGRLPAAFWLAWMVTLLCIGVEFCMTFWAADELRERAGASPAAATAGITAIVGGMFAGRLLGGRLALRVRPGRLLLAAVAVTLVGFAAFWSSTAPVPAVAGLVVVGLGIALQYPLGTVRAVAASAGRPDRAAGRLSVAAGLASGVAPFALGALADSIGTHAAFLLVPALLLVAAAGVLVSGDVRAGRAQA
jgi:predicted MFS family arabinose efflux permease